MTAEVELTLSVDPEIDPAEIPDRQLLERWVRNALGRRSEPTVVDMRVMGEAEMTALNRTYRRKNRPTNVLSFPAEPLPGAASAILGDIAICAPVLHREAVDQGKPREHHWAHLVTHGVLHLLGYDHRNEPEAAEMEAREAECLAALGFPNPYE